MALSFPRTDIMSFTRFQVEGYSFEPQERQEFSRQANGVTRGKDIGDPLWRGTFKTIPIPIDSALEFRTMLRSLDGVIQCFEAHDLRRPFPKLAPDYMGGGSINALGLDNKSLRVSGLPSGMTLSVGDYFSYELDGVLRLHQLVEAATASGAGVTGFFEVWPHFPLGMMMAPALNFARPAALMSIEPGSIQLETLPGRLGTVSFGAFQVFPYVAPPIDPAVLFSGGAPGAWFDYSDAATTFSNTGGTAVAVQGGPVQRVNDKSPFARHRTQTTGSLAPLLSTLGGRSALLFDGVDDWLTGSTMFPAGVAMAHFCVLRATKSAWLLNNTDPAALPAPYGPISQSGVGTATLFGFTGSPAAFVNGAPAATRGDVHTGTLNSTVILESRALSVAAPAANIVLGRASTQIVGGHVCEEIYCREDVAAANRAAIMAYLAGRWGVSAWS